MSRVNLFNGITISVEGTSRKYHSYDDWGLYVTNTDCIGEPKQYTKYVEIPGRTGKVDLSESLSGRPIFLSRDIKVSLAGPKAKTGWDAVISTFRNKIQGHICRIVFDNDALHYWRGRVEIVNFSSVLDLGKFDVHIPEADPYKYSTTSSTEPWLWDPFNFLTDVITYLPSQQITGSGTVKIPAGNMLTTPELVVADIVGDSFTVTYGGTTYNLVQGSNVIPPILVGGDAEVTLAFTGTAKVQVVYRSGSL